MKNARDLSKMSADAVDKDLVEQIVVDILKGCEVSASLGRTQTIGSYEINGEIQYVSTYPCAFNDEIIRRLNSLGFETRPRNGSTDRTLISWGDR